MNKHSLIALICALVTITTLCNHDTNNQSALALNTDKALNKEEFKALEAEVICLGTQLEALVEHVAEKLDTFKQHAHDMFDSLEAQKRRTLEAYDDSFYEIYKERLTILLQADCARISNTLQKDIDGYVETYAKKLNAIWKNHRKKATMQEQSHISTEPHSTSIIAQVPRFSKKDIVGTLPDELHVLFELCTRYKELPLHELPRGVLFQGPPGTGKTFIAEALAGEAQFLYFYQSAPAMHGEYAHDGVIYVKHLFAEVQRLAQEANTPAIIVIDELDSVGMHRDTLGQGSASASMRNTLHQLMIELMKPHRDDQPPIIIIGTTNRVEDLDPALKRTERFDEIIQFNLPNQAQYEQAIRQFKNYYSTCENGTQFPIDIDLCLQHKLSLGDVKLIFKKAVRYAFAEHSPHVQTHHYRKAFDHIVKKKQKEFSRGFNHEREKLLKDLPLIKLAYAAHSTQSLDDAGCAILWKRLHKLLASGQEWEEFKGGTEQEIKKAIKSKQYNPEQMFLNACNHISH